jgi:hypothetical protein
MRMTVLLTVAILTLTTTYAAASENLAQVAHTALALAPTSFASAIGPAGDKHDWAQVYGVRGHLKAVCPGCLILDEFAEVDKSEAWVARFDYHYPKTWTEEQAAHFVETTIGPLVRGYTFEADSDSRSWRRGNTFIVVTGETSESGERTLLVRIGQFSNHNVHFAKYAKPLTDAQKNQLKVDFKNILSLALPIATQNFATLRGKKLIEGGSLGEHYSVALSFTILSTCQLEHDSASGAITHARWVLACETPAFVDDKASLAAFMRNAIGDALPNSFTQTPSSDSSVVGRWYDDSGLVSVSLSSRALGARTIYHVAIYHFYIE